MKHFSKLTLFATFCILACAGLVVSPKVSSLNDSINDYGVRDITGIYYLGHAGDTNSQTIQYSPDKSGSSVQSALICNDFEITSATDGTYSFAYLDSLRPPIKGELIYGNQNSCVTLFSIAGEWNTSVDYSKYSYRLSPHVFINTGNRQKFTVTALYDGHPAKGIGVRLTTNETGHRFSFEPSGIGLKIYDEITPTDEHGVATFNTQINHHLGVVGVQLLDEFGTVLKKPESNGGSYRNYNGLFGLIFADNTGLVQLLVPIGVCLAICFMIYKVLKRRART